MLKFLKLLVLLVPFVLLVPSLASAQSVSREAYYKAEVTQIVEEGQTDNGGIKNDYQLVKLKFLDGAQEGKEISLEHGGKFTLSERSKVKKGDKIVLLELSQEGLKPEYQIIDKYRLDNITAIAVGFIILVLSVAHFKGVGSILGLAISLGVIVKFIVPQILAGRDPVLISVAGSLMIMATTLYLAHGFSKKTTVALVATFLSLGLTAGLAILFVNLAHLTGLGNENAYSLRFGGVDINFKGLLLGGIIIGTLGVLDDTTTTQSATIFELKKANGKLKFLELFERGLSVGREHIASLVNTLVLAYAGVSLPIFLAFVLNPGNTPLWAILNSEFISEEIIRALAGSIGLILAVPITTLIASYFASREKKA